MDGRTSLHVQEPWFTQITDGNKIIECRAGHIGAYDDIIGRKIVITNGPTTVNKMVSKVIHFTTLRAYVEACGWFNVAPHTGSIDAAMTAYRAVLNEQGEPMATRKIAVHGGMNAIYFDDWS